MFAAHADRADVSAGTVGAFGVVGGPGDVECAAGGGYKQKGVGGVDLGRRPLAFEFSLRGLYENAPAK